MIRILKTAGILVLYLALVAMAIHLYLVDTAESHHVKWSVVRAQSVLDDSWKPAYKVSLTQTGEGEFAGIAIAKDGTAFRLRATVKEGGLVAEGKSDAGAYIGLDFTPQRPDFFAAHPRLMLCICTIAFCVYLSGIVYPLLRPLGLRAARTPRMERLLAICAVIHLVLAALTACAAWSAVINWRGNL